MIPLVIITFSDCSEPPVPFTAKCSIAVSSFPILVSNSSKMSLRPAERLEYPLNQFRDLDLVSVRVLGLFPAIPFLDLRV